jgi:N utilization substance protein A
MLTGYNINIISKAKLQERLTKSADNLLQVSGITDPLAQMLVQVGVMNVGDLISTSAEEVSQALSIEVSDAQSIIDVAMKGVDDGSIKIATEEDEDFVSATATPAYSGLLDKKNSDNGDSENSEKFSEAERRLREELAAFKIK